MPLANRFITIDEFAYRQQSGRQYVGFVIGLGRAYIKDCPLPPPQFPCYTNAGRVPLNQNCFSVLKLQGLDTSPEMMKRSLEGAQLIEERYIVQSRDTLWDLARHFDVSVDDIKRWNRLTNDTIRVGQPLLIKSPILFLDNSEIMQTLSRSNSQGVYEIPFTHHWIDPSLTTIGNNLSVVGYALKGLGGFGEGLIRAGGSFRLTDGVRGNISIGHYSSGWTGGSRALITTYNATQWGNRVLQRSGKPGRIVSAGQIMHGIAQDSREAGYLTICYNAKLKSVEVVGGMAGAWAGAKIGAKIGTLIFPGVGTVIGGVVGAIVIGAVAGTRSRRRAERLMQQ